MAGGAKLIVTDTSTGDSFSHVLSEGECRIGRSHSRANLVLDFPEVSRVHAIVLREGDRFLLKDLGSVNGTSVEGRRIQEQLLSTGDSFVISKFSIEFQDQPDVDFEPEEQVSDRTFHVSKLDEFVALPAKTVERPGTRPAGEMTVLSRKAETLARLYELNRTLGSVFSLPEIFGKLSDMLLRLTPADRVLVLLRDPRTGEISTASAKARSAEEDTTSIRVSRTVVSRVLDECVALLSVDAAIDKRLVSANSILAERIHSIMCAPLLVRDKPLGVIYVDCRDFTKVFTDADLDLVSALAAATAIALDNARTHEQLLKEALARAAYGRFIPRHVVDEILANPQALSLGGSNRSVAVLFSDVRGFTSVAERLAPELAVQLLNQYFSEMAPVVFENEGLLDKYLGDGLMALFGVPFGTDVAAKNAVQAAISMQKQMQRVNADLLGRNLPQIEIGIGISGGTATVGYIGSKERTDYTAIGDTVNLAARLEKQACAAEIIVSQAVFEAVKDIFPIQAAGEVAIRGKMQPVAVYQVLWKETAAR